MDINLLVWYFMAFLGFVSTGVLIFAVITLQSYLIVPLQVKLFGGKVAKYYRGVKCKLIRLPADAKTYTLKRKDGTEYHWIITPDSERLAPGGILETCLVDVIPVSLSPDMALKAAEQMANAHIENLKTFMVDDPKNPGKKIPALDPVQWEKAPSYVLPEILSNDIVAEAIKSEASAKAEIIHDKDQKPYYTLMGFGGIVIVIVVLVLLVKFGFEYELCQSGIQALANAAQSTPTTTLASGSSLPASMV